MGIYEESGLTIASQTITENQDGESILILEVVNNSYAVVGVSTTNIDINGLRVCDSTWSYDTINPGKTAIVDIDLSLVLEPEYWGVYGITEVGNVALKVSFKNDDNKEISSQAFLSIDIPALTPLSVLTEQKCITGTASALSPRAFTQIRLSIAMICTSSWLQKTHPVEHWRFTMYMIPCPSTITWPHTPSTLRLWKTAPV